MGNRPDIRWFWIFGGIISITAIAGLVIVVHHRQVEAPSLSTRFPVQTSLEFHPSQHSIQMLKSFPLETLSTIATQSELSLDRSRARYLLAEKSFSSDPATALSWLKNLDHEYPVIAPHVLSLQAQLQEKSGDLKTAEAIWRSLLKRYGKSPIAAEALYALGQADSAYHDRLLAQWPAHPLAMEITLKRLEQQPDNVDLLLRVARHGLYTFRIDDTLSQLVEKYAAQLQPEDWETIGFAYWEKLNYPAAALAYAKAPPTSRNLYRAARSFQISNQIDQALNYYQTLVSTFPQATETELGLKRLAPLIEQRDLKQALTYWDHLYNNFPNAAGDALLGKADVLDALGSKASATQARQSILSQYSNSDAAAKMRWRLVQVSLQSGDLEKAAQLAQAIPQLNPRSEIAPEAGFWAGRWWQDLAQPQKAQQVFQEVLRRYPESYYAWRSAVFLNFPVGDFTTVWQRQPEITHTEIRSALPVGSELLQELYQLGQDGTAWRVWQVEFTHPMEPTVAEQFTDGLIRISVGDYLDGIFMLNSLAWRDSAAEKEQYVQLRQDPGFWNSLYPQPFQDSVQNWSNQRQLNPLLVISLMRQESRFMPGIISSAGATGLMQVMPETGAWVAEEVGLSSYQLNDPDDSVNLGSWYLNYTHEAWGGNSLLAIASYNAGPGNVEDWVIRFGFDDPDIFVEQIPFAETKGYVEAVFENYWNYLRLYNPEVSDLVAQYSPEHIAIALQSSQTNPKQES